MKIVKNCKFVHGSSNNVNAGTLLGNILFFLCFVTL